jgi:hypothetical protein
MDIQGRIADRARTIRVSRRYYTYDLPFPILLAIADSVTYIYFFGIPFFPEWIPQVGDIHMVVQFFMEGFRKASER